MKRRSRGSGSQVGGQEVRSGETKRRSQLPLTLQVQRICRFAALPVCAALPGLVLHFRSWPYLYFRWFLCLRCRFLKGRNCSYHFCISPWDASFVVKTSWRWWVKRFDSCPSPSLLLYLQLWLHSFSSQFQLSTQGHRSCNYEWSFGCVLM